MTCQITSKFGPDLEIPTDVDQSKRDSVNIINHIDVLLLSPQVANQTRVETCWPGLGDPIVTTRLAGETVSEWLTRHENKLLLAALTDPIDCSATGC